MPTMTIDATTTKTVRMQTILSRSVCLLLSCGYVGTTRKVELSEMKLQKDGDDVDQPKGELAASKRLFGAKDLQACNRTQDSARNYLQSIDRALAGRRVFGAGTYLIPVALIEEVEARLEQYRTDLAKHADELAGRLTEIIEERRAKLGPFFNLGDYPTPDGVKAAYRLDWSYVSFSAPEQLAEVDRAVFEKAQAKYQGKLAAAYDEVVVGLRESALVVMQELANKLKPDTNGKPKALHPAALKDLQELLGRLPVLNLTDDDKLVNTLAKVGSIAQHLDVEVLRKAPGVRDMLLTAAEKATKDLDKLVMSGRRAISFSKPKGGE